MNAVRCLALVLFSSLQWHTSVTSFSKLLGQGKKALELIQQGSSSKSFDIDKLAALDVHNEGDSWLNRNLVPRGPLPNDEQEHRMSYHDWLALWAFQWAWMEKPYELKDISFIHDIVEAFKKTIPNHWNPMLEKNLEKAINNARKEIMLIDTTSPKAIDIYTMFIGVLAMITMAGTNLPVPAAITFARQYFHHELVDTITSLIADEADLLQLFHTLCDFHRPT